MKVVDLIKSKNSPSFQSIGTFETNGQLVVIDPCYELTKNRIKLKTKPGTYEAFVIYGKMKEPPFQWDKEEGNFRNSHLIIIKNDYQGEFKFKKHQHYVDVDSGQAGFFNLDTYRKDQETDVELKNYPYNFLKEHITTKKIDIMINETYLKEAENNELFVKIQKTFNGDREKTIKYFQSEIDSAKLSIQMNQKYLNEGKIPSYLQKKFSKDFYDIMCDLTKAKFEASASEYGAVSSSGIGDGGYELYTSKNEDDEIVCAYIEFLSLDAIVLK